MSWPRTLSLRLASAFALVTVLLLGALGLYLYQSLQREIVWRDDQALLGRLERMQALIDDSGSIDALRSRPRLYDNMLGNRDDALWILDAGQVPLIEINPSGHSIPSVPGVPTPSLGDSPPDNSMRLAWMDVSTARGRLTLIAGKSSLEREQMLASYRLRLWIALAAGGISAFLLGWLVSQRGLRPVRVLARQAAAIDSHHLHLRLDSYEDVRELTELSQALNQMLGRLEQGFAQLSRFSEDLAHEMRTPLSNLMTQTQYALARDRSVTDYQHLLASSQEEYERLARMIDSMLFLARAEQSGSAIERAVVDLRMLGNQLCEYFEGMGEERDIRLLNRCEAHVLANADLIRRAVANLLSNALRHASASSTVTISSRCEPTGVFLGVHNVGEPISEQHLPHLFERFYRCDPSRNSPDDSGGLGLAIVQSIMQMHGGGVEVRSSGGGTTFELFFPSAEAPSP